MHLGYTLVLALQLCVFAFGFDCKTPFYAECEGECGVSYQQCNYGVPTRVYTSRNAVCMQNGLRVNIVHAMDCVKSVSISTSTLPDYISVEDIMVQPTKTKTTQSTSDASSTTDDDSNITTTGTEETSDETEASETTTTSSNPSVNCGSQPGCEPGPQNVVMKWGVSMASPTYLSFYAIRVHTPDPLPGHNISTGPYPKQLLAQPNEDGYYEFCLCFPLDRYTGGEFFKLVAVNGSSLSTNTSSPEQYDVSSVIKSNNTSDNLPEQFTYPYGFNITYKWAQKFFGYESLGTQYWYLAGCGGFYPNIIGKTWADNVDPITECANYAGFGNSGPKLSPSFPHVSVLAILYFIIKLLF